MVKWIYAFIGRRQNYKYSSTSSSLLSPTQVSSFLFSSSPPSSSLPSLYSTLGQEFSALHYTAFIVETRAGQWVATWPAAVRQIVRCCHPTNMTYPAAVRQNCAVLSSNQHDMASSSQTNCAVLSSNQHDMASSSQTNCAVLSSNQHDMCRCQFVGSKSTERMHAYVSD